MQNRFAKAVLLVFVALAVILFSFYSLNRVSESNIFDKEERIESLVDERDALQDTVQVLRERLKEQED